MKKLIFSVILLLILVVFLVCAEEEKTTFTAFYTTYKDGSVIVEVRTDKTEGVGGINMMLVAKNWSVVKNSANSKLKKSDIVEDADAGKVHLLWDTADRETLPRTILKASFQPKSDSADISEITLQVNEYYDNTSSLSDLPFAVTAETRNADRASAEGNLIIWIVLAITAVAAVVFLIVWKGKYIYGILKKLKAKW